MTVDELIEQTTKLKQTAALVKAVIDILEQHLPDDTGNRILPQLVSPETGIIPDDVIFDYIDRFNQDLQLLEHDMEQYKNRVVQPSKAVKKAAKIASDTIKRLNKDADKIFKPKA